MGHERPLAVVPCLRSERFVICAESRGIRYKLVQNAFQRRDGSVLLSFPYYEHTTGLVSLATLQPRTSVLDLTPGGKITSHLVKYSHHPDGHAHFSQDRKVFTRVKKDALPLDELEGHLFTVQVQGLESFQALDPAEYDAVPTARKTILNFDFGDDPPQAVKIVGSIHRQESLAQRTGRARTPRITVIDPQGFARPGFLLSTPLGRPGEGRILMLTCEGVPSLTTDEETTLTFIGGFDPPAIVADESKPTTMLALMYPAITAEELRPRLGSIDFTTDGTLE
jgi:hypothetical protein